MLFRSMEFDPGVSVGAGATMIILSFNPDNPANAARLDAFRAQYGLDDTVAMLGGYGGQLSDNGERVQLQRATRPIPVQPTVVSHLYEDELIYDNLPPWGTSAAGGGDSLQRSAPVFFGSFSSSWSAAPASPGTVDFSGNTVGDFNGDGEVTTDDIDVLQNAVRANTDVLYYDLDGDLSVDTGDVNFLVQNVIGTFIGDAQLDGQVDAADLNQVGVNWRRTNVAGWGQGDFTGDGRVDAADLNLIALNWQNGVPAAAAEAQDGNRRSPRAPLAGLAKVNSTSVTDAALASLDHASSSVSEIDFFNSDINATTILRHDIGLMPRVDFQLRFAGERKWSPWIDRHETTRLERSGSMDATASANPDQKRIRKLSADTLDEVFALSSSEAIEGRNRLL